MRRGGKTYLISMAEQSLCNCNSIGCFALLFTTCNFLLILLKYYSNLHIENQYFKRIKSAYIAHNLHILAL